jgi:lysophospholipase L1-like esterase
MAKNIYWAGDSTVKTNKITTYPQTGIGQVMYLYLKDDYSVCNYAENGRSTKSFMDEGRLEKINERISKGDFLFIQFGHNDQKIDDPSRYTDLTTYKCNLKKYIEVALNKEAYPILITSLYRRLFNEEGQLMDNVHQGYPEACIEVASEMQVPLIDLCEASRCLLEKTVESKSKEWFMNLPANTFKAYPEGKLDNTHMTYQGAIVMAELIAEGLIQLGGIYSEMILEELININSVKSV